LKLPAGSSPHQGQGRKVLVVIQALTQGGSERQAVISAIGLRRLGWDSHVAVQRAGGFRSEELQRAGVPVHVFPLRSFPRDGFGQAWSLGRFLRRERFQVMHAFDTPGNLFAVPVARLAGVPVVLASQRAHRDLSVGPRRRLLQLCDRLAHGVVVNCRYLVNHLVKDEGVRPEKVHLCYNGLDTATFHPDGPAAQLPFPQGSIVIGVVCALRPEKDLMVLVDAFARIGQVFEQARLLIVGSGPEREALQGRVQQHGIWDRTHFEQSVADTAPWLRAIDIFVLPSRLEAFSNSLMEAMACGAVAVASQVGGNPELAAPGRGLLFPVGNVDALAGVLGNLLRDPEQREQMRQDAAIWVKAELNLDRMAARLEAIYLNAGGAAA
jgi:L-malate glycosyltransferase